MHQLDVGDVFEALKPAAFEDLLESFLYAGDRGTALGELYAAWGGRPLWASFGTGGPFIRPLRGFALPDCLPSLLVAFLVDLLVRELLNLNPLPVRPTLHRLVLFGLRDPQASAAEDEEGRPAAG